MINIMDADHLAIQGARASVSMVLKLFSQNIPAFVQKG